MIAKLKREETPNAFQVGKTEELKLLASGMT